MTVEQFLSDPWHKSHRVYLDSGLAMTPAPEYASSEVLVSSLYRVAGYPQVKEGDVPERGRALDKLVQFHRDNELPREGAALDPGAFLAMLHTALESPKLPNQSSKRFLQVSPLIPDAALFSGSPRLTGNPWSAGTLVRRLCWLGSASAEDAAALWDSIFDALSVLDDDDIFARFLRHEAMAWIAAPEWSKAPIPVGLPTGGWGSVQYPARQLARDLRAIVAAKGLLTRRQWTSLLEAILRIGCVSHVIWTCEVHARSWRAVRASLAGGGPSGEAEASDAMFPATFSYLSYGDRAIPPVKDRVALFLQARLGLNLALWTLDELGVDHAGGLGSPSELAALCEAIRGAREAFGARGFQDAFDQLMDDEGQTLLCKKGIGSNMVEFARHALGQRQSASELLRGYDQGFALRKKSAAKQSPFIVGLGPVAILALVHCSLAGARGPRSVKRLAQHIAGYGISVDPLDIARNELGHQLRLLGLVLDSPDAESGMLLVPPFEGNA